MRTYYRVVLDACALINEPNVAGRYHGTILRGQGLIAEMVTNHERAARQARVARAVASVRLEGLEPTDAAKALFDHYVAGDLTTQEMTAEIQSLNAREFGPIHVPGD